MCEALGYKVTELRRVRIINVDLGTLKIGAGRNLTDGELARLLPDAREW